MTQRLEKALVKLYNAFHNDELNPECCSACAVGNILDKDDSWREFSITHGSLKLTHIGSVYEKAGKTFNGYSPLEILQIEKVFLEACGFKLPLCYYNPKPKDPRNKEILFNGLSAVVNLLCDLDNVSNVMGYSKIFEYDNENPVYKFEAIY